MPARPCAQVLDILEGYIKEMDLGKNPLAALCIAPF